MAEHETPERREKYEILNEYKILLKNTLEFCKVEIDANKIDKEKIAPLAKLVDKLVGLNRERIQFAKDCEPYEFENWPDQLLLDAKVLKQLCRVTRRLVEGFSVNPQKFDASEFAEKLFKYFDTENIGTQHYVKLGDKLQHVFAKPACLQYVYGSLEKDQKVGTSPISSLQVDPKKI